MPSDSVAVSHALLPVELKSAPTLKENARVFSGSNIVIECRLVEKTS